MSILVWQILTQSRQIAVMAFIIFFLNKSETAAELGSSAQLPNFSHPRISFRYCPATHSQNYISPTFLLLASTFTL